MNSDLFITLGYVGISVGLLCIICGNIPMMIYKKQSRGGKNR